MAQPHECDPPNPRGLCSTCLRPVGREVPLNDHIRSIMTDDRARYVRRLRVEEDHTWRSVASLCFEAWGDLRDSNQIVGMALCEVAAERFGENYCDQQWNG